MNILGLFTSQREFVRAVVEKKLIVPAIIFGFFGTYLLALSSFITRVFLKSTKPDEIFIMLIKEPLISIFYFIVSVILVYFIARLFRGENRLVDYLVANGFGGLFSFIFFLTFTPVGIISKFFNQNNPNANMPLVLLILVLTFSALATIIFLIKYSIVSISEVFKLKIGKSILVFIIVMVPLFLIANNLWQVK